MEISFKTTSSPFLAMFFPFSHWMSIARSILNILSGFRSATISAVKAATKRSMQLGGVSEDDITNKYNL